jgi:hypothetical protein
MNNDPINALQENRSYQMFGFARQMRQATILLEVLQRLTYASVLILSLPLFFIPF